MQFKLKSRGLSHLPLFNHSEARIHALVNETLLSSAQTISVCYSFNLMVEGVEKHFASCHNAETG